MSQTTVEEWECFCGLCGRENERCCTMDCNPNKGRFCVCRDCGDTTEDEDGKEYHLCDFCNAKCEDDEWFICGKCCDCYCIDCDKKMNMEWESQNCPKCDKEEQEEECDKANMEWIKEQEEIKQTVGTQ